MSLVLKQKGDEWLVDFKETWKVSQESYRIVTDTFNQNNLIYTTQFGEDGHFYIKLECYKRFKDFEKYREFVISILYFKKEYGKIKEN